MKLKIEKGLVEFGKNKGRIAVNCQIGEGHLLSVNKMLDKITGFGTKLVSFEGDFTNNPEVYTIVSGLVNGGYEVIYSTDAGDEVGNMVRLRNLTLSIKVEIPEEDKPSNFLPHILNYLLEKDELRFEVKNKEDYKKFREFERLMNITRPLKVLEVDKEYQTSMENIIKDELTGFDRIIIKYK